MDVLKSRTKPSVARQSRRSNLVNPLALVAFFVVGALSAIALMPWVFRAIPSDRSRTGVLLRALGSGRPTIIVFGDSVTMSGVNAHWISASLPGHPVVWNFSSPSQDLAESFLYYQDLPKSVRTIVQVVSPNVLEATTMFQPDVYSAFYMNGYRPSRETLVSLRYAYGESIHQILGQQGYEQSVAARWVVQQGLDTAVRRVLRRDLEVDRGVRDLYYPAVFTVRLPAATLRVVLDPYHRKRPLPGLMVSAQTKRLLHKMADFAVRTGRHLVLIFPPVSPVMQHYYGDRFMLDLSRFKIQYRIGGMTVINASKLIPTDQYFADERHLLPPAARIFTELLSSALARSL